MRPLTTLATAMVKFVIGKQRFSLVVQILRENQIETLWTTWSVVLWSSGSVGGTRLDRSPV